MDEKKVLVACSHHDPSSLSLKRRVCTPLSSVGMTRGNSHYEYNACARLLMIFKFVAIILFACFWLGAGLLVGRFLG